jgi:hypothetical protein
MEKPLCGICGERHWGLCPSSEPSAKPAATTAPSGKFDRTAYQRDYMRSGDYLPVDKDSTKRLPARWRDRLAVYSLVPILMWIAAPGSDPAITGAVKFSATSASPSAFAASDHSGWLLGHTILMPPRNTISCIIGKPGAWKFNPFPSTDFQVQPADFKMGISSSRKLIGSDSGCIATSYSTPTNDLILSIRAAGLEICRGASLVSNAAISWRWISDIQPSLTKISIPNAVSAASERNNNSQPRCCFSFPNLSPSQYTPRITPAVETTNKITNIHLAISKGPIRDLLNIASSILLAVSAAATVVALLIFAHRQRKRHRWDC